MTEEKLVTITVSEETRKRLEKVKGNLDWDTFLRIVAAYFEEKQRKFEEELEKLNLTEEELKAIEESHKKMHEEFKI